MNNKNNDQAIIALKKARTSIDNVLKMIDEGKYCIDVIQQILAIQGLLKSSSGNILRNHLNSCFVNGMHSDNKEQKEALVDELMKVIKFGEK